MSALGAALKHLRERRTLSLRELAQLSGVDHAYIHRLETGAKDSPSPDRLGKLTRALKVSEREAEMLRWLSTHPDAHPETVKYCLDEPTVDLDVFTAAAGARFRGTGRPDPATLVARIRRAFDED